MYGGRRYHFDWRSFITPGVKLLVLVCTGVFLVQTFLGLLAPPAATIWLLKWFALIPEAVTHHLPPRLWQPFTYIFLHGGLFHLLINMLILWMFGRDLELVWGKRRFLNYFCICGVGAVTPTIGASGAIFGILMANAVLFPDRRIWLIPLPVTIPMRPYVAVMGAIEFFSTIGAGGDNVSHVCHLGGMLVGYLYLRRGTLLYNVRNTVTDWQHKRNRKRFDVYINKHKKEPPSRPDNWVN
jgi:membrane associated rhomboid family serine protease